ncbi:MAG: PQQ-binding-like beta-propeller repeat protein, partial [Pseudomonadota bacterium]
MIRNRIYGATALALAMLAGCQPAEQQAAATPQQAAPTAASDAAAVTQERLNNAGSEPGQWMMVGGTYEERHYSALNQITRDNVNTLGLSWFADYDTNLSQQGTPLYVDGVIYVSTAWSKVYAYDVRTGQQLWQYDPKTPKEIAV